MTQKIEPEWHYEIKYGPEGEANYAWLYRGNDMVATMKTHHAVAIAAALAAAEERGRIEERERCAKIAADMAPFTEETISNSTAGAILIHAFDVTLSRFARRISAAITKEPTQ